MYESAGMGMTEVRAASGVLLGPPGSWWSRNITPEGESRHAEKSVSRNWSHTIGGGPLRSTPRFWMHPVGPPTDYPDIRGIGTDGDVAPSPPPPSSRQPDIADPSRSIHDAIREATGSSTVAGIASWWLMWMVPGFRQRSPYMFLLPLGMAAGAGGVQYLRKKSVKTIALTSGIAYLLGPAAGFVWFLAAGGLRT